jgi:1-phosphofructokinase family hexose kinase
MILTVTPNPSIDRVFFVRNFRLGGIVRAEREEISPCGKGVIASMVIHELGGATTALGLKAGITGNLHANLLDDLGVKHDFIPAYGETRTLVVLVDLAVGRQSSISASTLTATSEHLTQLIDLMKRYTGQAWGVIFGGSLPPGFPADSYAHLVRCTREAGLITLLDSSGDALRQGVAGLPHILKINQEELNTLDPGLLNSKWHDSELDFSGSDEPDQHSDAATPHVPGDIIELTGKLSARFNKWASHALIVTLGKQGAVAVTTEGIYYAHPPAVPVINTAGAGDAVSGGVLLARSQGADWAAALTLGVAAAASVVMNEGSGICHRSQVEMLRSQLQVIQVNA